MWLDGTGEGTKGEKMKLEFERGGRCRICGGSTYTEVRKNINGILGPGACVKTLYCVCNQCSTMFQDPKVFCIIPDSGTGDKE